MVRIVGGIAEVGIGGLATATPLAPLGILLIGHGVLEAAAGAAETLAAEQNRQISIPSPLAIAVTGSTANTPITPALNVVDTLITAGLGGYTEAAAGIKYIAPFLSPQNFYPFLKAAGGVGHLSLLAPTSVSAPAVAPLTGGPAQK